MTEPHHRLHRMAGNLVTTMEPFAYPDGLWPKLRFDRTDRYEPGGKWWFCDHAPHELWFREKFLEMGRKAYRSAQYQYRKALERGEIIRGEPEWSFFGPWCVDGDRIKLRCANGNWVWVLTGQTRPDLDYGDPARPTGDQLRHQAVWPD